MTSACFDPQFLQQQAQAQLQAALHLNSAVRSHLPMQSSAEPNSNKRYSSSSLSPEPKRAAVSRTSSPGDHPLHGFTRIPLRRAFSDPIPSQEMNHVPAPASSSVSTRLPEESTGVKSSLHRSWSDPIPETHSPPLATPPRHPAAGKVAPLPPTPQRCGLSPNAKRAKRLQEGLIQMMKLWDELEKVEEEVAASQNANHCSPHKDDCEASNASGTQELCDEAVWVERKGETRILHFKCHCNKAYKILFSGNDCYYKLNCF